MSFPEGFEATDFFYPTEKQKQDYFITGREVVYWFEPGIYGTFDYNAKEWAEILTNKPPIVYYVFKDDKCWVSKWTTTEQDMAEEAPPIEETTTANNEQEL